MTADDFGFSHGVNQAILRAHRDGVVTSASLMVTGDAADEAVAIARANPTLAVGLHLVVVCGRAALASSEIPALVDKEGRFPRGAVGSGLRYQLGGAAREQLRREIREQLRRFRDTGLNLSHVDGHLHMHLHPVVLSCLVDLAPEFGIPAIRLPKEELAFNLAFERRDAARKTLWSWIFSRLRASGERRLRPAGIAFADRVYGLLQTGRVGEAYWLDLLPRLRATDAREVEIYCHPDSALPGEPLNGPPGAGPAELHAVLSPRVRRAIADADFTLSSAASPSATAAERPAPALALAPEAAGRPS